MYAYNPSIDSWSSVAVFPRSITRGSRAATVNGKGYVMGGTVSRGSATVTNRLYEYDPIMDVWTQKANFPGGGRTGGIVFLLDSNFYFGLGHNHSVDFNDLWKYNPRLNLWSIVDSFPGLPRFNASVFVVNGKAIAGGGARYGVSGAISDYYCYDIINDNWSVVPNFSNNKRFASITFSLGGKGYIATGLDSTRVNTLNDVWEYTDTSFVTSLLAPVKPKNAYIIYPNPAVNDIMIKSKSDGLIDLIDIRGKILKRDISIDANQVLRIDLEGLDKGIYFIQIQSQEGQNSQKFIIQ